MTSFKKLNVPNVRPLFLLTDIATTCIIATCLLSYVTYHICFAMAEELASGGPTCDWGGGLPAELMGKIASFLKFPDDMTHEEEAAAGIAHEDSAVGYDRKAIANGRRVCRHWSSTLPLAVTRVHTSRNRPAPTWSTTLLSSVTSLTWNVCSGEECITDIVDALVGHGTLTDLTINGPYSDGDIILQDVGRLTSLETLVVGRFNISDLGLQALSSLTGLAVLRVSGGVQVTDSCIKTLCGSLVRLRELTLHRFSLITDESLPLLAELADRGDLIDLYISGSPLITREGWASFRDARPGSTSNKVLEVLWMNR